MQDLRDKLVKAGLASKKQARKAKTDKRRQRKKQGGEKADQQQRAERQQAWQQQQAEQAEASRKLAAEQAQRREQQEHQARVANVIHQHALQRIHGNDRVFHFVGPDRRIRRLHTSHAVATALEQGSLAIVQDHQHPGRDYSVVRATAAQKLEQMSEESQILFWNKPGAPQDGDLPPYGAS